MADLKISALVEVTAPVTSDVLPVVNAASTKKVTIANLVSAAMKAIVQGSLSGTSTPFLSHTVTWNNAGTTFVNILSNVTDTASAAASRLLELQVGGLPAVKLFKSGQVQFGGNSGAASWGTTISGSTVTLGRPFGDGTLDAGTEVLEWLSTGNILSARGFLTLGTTAAAKDTGLARNAAGVVEVNTAVAGTLASLVTDGLNVGTASSPTTKQARFSDGSLFKFIFAAATPALSMASNSKLQWSSTTGALSTFDSGLARSAAGLLEVNDSNVGTFRDLKLRDLFFSNGPSLLASTAADILEQRNGINFQQFRLYGTTDSGTANYTRLTVNSNSGLIIAEKAGTGPAIDMGLHNNAAGKIRFAIAGTFVWEILTTNHLTPIADDTYDLGGSATRVRKGFFGDISALRKLTAYQNLATEGAGAVAVYRSVATTGQVGSITTSNLQVASAIAPVGLYLVSVYTVVTTVGTGTLLSTIGWNDGTAARTIASAGISATATNFEQVRYLVRADGANNITYATTRSVSDGAYSIYVVLERLT